MNYFLITFRHYTEFTFFVHNTSDLAPHNPTVVIDIFIPAELMNTVDNRSLCSEIEAIMRIYLINRTTLKVN